jgi:hypothetical protein
MMGISMSSQKIDEVRWKKELFGGLSSQKYDILLVKKALMDMHMDLRREFQKKCGGVEILFHMFSTVVHNSY